MTPEEEIRYRLDRFEEEWIGRFHDLKRDVEEIHAAFPDKDLSRHHDAHRVQYERDDDWKEIRKAVVKKLFEFVAPIALGTLAAAVWMYFKAAI